MISTLECIGNTVGGFSIGTAEWEGVTLNHLLDEAGFDQKTFDLVLRDGYSELPIFSGLGRRCLACHKNEWSALAARSWVSSARDRPRHLRHEKCENTGLELVHYDYKRHWQQQSWSDTALVKLSSRIDLPGDRELITTPRYTMKGIAFNGRNKIQKIEVSTDEGKTWREGILRPKLSHHTWTPWSYEWTIPKSGEYTIMAQATNEHGLTQSLNQLAHP